MRRLGKYEKRAKIYAAYCSAVEGTSYYFVVKHKTPIWSDYKGPDQEWAVYFKSKENEKGCAHMTGHHIEKDLAYKMILDFYMAWKNLSWEEIKIKAAIAGIKT